MYWQNSMTGYAKIIQATRRWPIELIPKDTTGQPCEQMQLPMLGSVIAARDRPRFKGAGSRPYDHNEPLALRLVGNGHRKATAYRPGSKEAIIGCH